MEIPTCVTLVSEVGFYNNKDTSKGNMDSAGTSTIKEEARTAESTGTLYRDFPDAPDPRTPPLFMHQLDGPRYTVKPKEYAGEESWRSYRSHFERVATLNRWKEEKLEYLWVNLTGAALGESLPALRQEVRRLVSCAYPGFPLEAMEEIAVERFLDALDQR